MKEQPLILQYNLLLGCVFEVHVQFREITNVMGGNPHCGGIRSMWAYFYYV